MKGVFSVNIHLSFDKLKADIVANARPFRARARVAWIGARFSDGSECTKEKARALADSVKPERFAPPLLIDHNWSAEEIKGHMVSLNLDEGGNLIADFDITDEETISKLMSGEWGDVSLTFDAGTLEVQECSIVAIPYVKGARFEIPRESEAQPAEEMPAEVVAEEIVSVNREYKDDVMPEAEEKREEWMPGEGEKTDKENPEDWPDSAEGKTKEKKPAENPADDLSVDEKEAGRKAAAENRCGGKRKTVSNAMVANALVENAQLKAENETLRQTVSALREKLDSTERSNMVNHLVRSWIENRYILPCEAEAEAAFLSALHKTDADLFGVYCKNKANSRAAVVGGKRMSAPVTKAATVEEQREKAQVDYWNSLKQNEK